MIVWLIVFTVWITLLYKGIGISKIVKVLSKLREREYWKPLYNRLEFISWMSKIGIIVPGLIWGKEIWWLHTITLVTSSLLIWVKMEKGLPTLIIFNTIWIGISSWILVKNLLMILNIN
jgi:hypothetical protein